MSDDRFFERLREDARALRYAPDSAAMTRISARIRAGIAPQPTVALLLAQWFRPLAATLTAVALAATIGITLSAPNDQETYAAEPIEISMAGDSFNVGE